MTTLGLGGGRVTGNWVSRIEEDIGSGGAYHPPSHQGAQQAEPLYFLGEGTGTLHGHWKKIVFGHSKINHHQISFPLNLLHRKKFIPQARSQIHFLDSDQIRMDIESLPLRQ